MEDCKGVIVNSYILRNSGVKEPQLPNNAYDIGIVNTNQSDNIYYNVPSKCY